MEIRQLTPEDWPDVRRIYQLGIDTDLATFETDAPEWDTWNANHLAAPRLVAVNNGLVIGFAALSPISKRACYSGVAEVSIYVDTGSKGTGRALMTELIAQSEAAGFWTLQSSIFSENAASVRLHEAAGFRYVGRRERIAQRNGQWKDTLLYERRVLTNRH